MGAMKPVAPGDVLGVAWTLGRSFAPGRGRSRSVLGALTVPFWLLGLALLPGYVHHERRVVVRVARRGVRGYAAIAARVVVVLAVLVGLVLLAGAGPAWAAFVLTVIAVSWCAVVVGVIVMIPRTLEALAGMTASADKSARKADRVRVREAGWSVDSAASVERSGGLLLVRDYLLSVVPAGGVVLLQAATGTHARVYERLGCQRLASLPLKLTYRVP